MEPDLPSDEEIERRAARYYKVLRKDSFSSADFNTLADLLDFSSPVPVATLATAIERHGISGWDRFGRFIENDETIKKNALEALGRYVDWFSKEYLVFQWPDYPTGNISDCPLESELRRFAWKVGALPNFEEIGATIEAMPEPPRSKSGETRRHDTLMVLVAALAKQAGIDFAERGASRRIMEATERIGAPVSEDTIQRVIQAVPAALDKRDKTI